MTDFVRNFTVDHGARGIAAGQVTVSERLGAIERYTVVRSVALCAFTAMGVDSDRERAEVLYRIADELATGLDPDEFTLPERRAEPQPPEARRGFGARIAALVRRVVG